LKVTAFWDKTVGPLVIWSHQAPQKCSGNILPIKQCSIPEDINTVLTTIKTEREGNHARKKTNAIGIGDSYS